MIFRILKYLGISLIIVLVYSCRNNKILDENYIVLTKSKNNSYLKNRESWKPNKKDLCLYREIFKKAIYSNEFSFLKKPREEQISKYYKQLIPYYNKKGERVILVNAFCKIINLPNDKLDWKKTYVNINDGGNCYWKLLINLDTKTYMEYKRNASP